jgi:hypothetical protein
MMSGNEDVALAIARHWRTEREAQPSNTLLQFLGAAVEHTTKASVSGRPSPEQREFMHSKLVAYKRPKKRTRLALTDDRVLLAALATELGLEGQKRKRALTLVSDWLVDRISEQRCQTTDSVAKLLQVGAHGQNTLVPSEHKPLARELLQRWAEREQQGQFAAPTSESPTAPVPSRGSAPFYAEEHWHAASKDLVNRLWISALLSKGGGVKEGPVFFLDAFENPTSSVLRTTSALQEAGFKGLFLANPDEEICRQATAQHVQVYRGTWQQAAEAWSFLRFKGFYFDLCKGDRNYVEAQLLAAMPLAAPSCVLAVTVLPRCFEGWTHLERYAALCDFFTSRGWMPAAGLDRLLESTVVYRNSSSLNVFTQLWVSPADQPTTA